MINHCEKTGHLDKFSDLIYEVSSEDKSYAIKPMSCPGHIQVFNQGLKSIKISLNMLNLKSRDELNTSWLTENKRFTQDDAHIFCTAEQIEVEISTLIDNIYAIYKVFGFPELNELSTRPEKRVGSDEIWDSSESALKKAR